MSTASTAALPRGGQTAAVVGTVAAIALIGWLVAYEDVFRYAVNGDSYPGALTAYGAAIGRLLATLAASVTLGALFFTVFRTTEQKGGELGLRGYLAQRLALRAATVWAALSAPMVLLSAADNAGQDVWLAVQSGGVLPLISASETAKGWFYSLVAALIVVIVLKNALTWMAHLWVLPPAAVGLLAATVTANEAQGPNHDYSTAALMALVVIGAVWVGGLWAQTRVPARPEKRWTGPVLGAGVLLAGGAVALIMAPGPDLWQTLYGRLLLIAAAAAVIAAGLQFFRATVPALTATLIALAAGIAASELTPPVFLGRRFTIGEVFVGFDVTDPPTLMRILSLWRWDLNLAPLAVFFAVGYLLLVRRLRGWPWYRSALFVLGCAALVFVSSSGLNTYATVMFSWHMAAHMLMTSLVPVLLLLGAPITVLQLTATGAPARWLQAVLTSRSFGVLMRPVVQIALFAVVLYGLYFTGLYNAVSRYHWGHSGIYLVVLITGFLFYWRVLQIDPVPSELPFIGRVGMLLAMMPVSMVFALVVMTMNSLIGESLYLYLRLPWLVGSGQPEFLGNLDHDQFVGGVLAWAVDEAAIALVTLGMVLHWAWRNREADQEADLELV